MLVSLKHYLNVGYWLSMEDVILELRKALGIKHYQHLNPMNESPQLRPTDFIAAIATEFF